MANFYAECQGQRGAVHRLGASQACASVRSWSDGIEIVATREEKEVLEQGTKSDGSPRTIKRTVRTNVYKIYQRSGSNGGGSSKLLATFKEGVFTPEK